MEIELRKAYSQSVDMYGRTIYYDVDGKSYTEEGPGKKKKRRKSIMTQLRTARIVPKNNTNPEPIRYEGVLEWLREYDYNTEQKLQNMIKRDLREGKRQYFTGYNFFHMDTLLQKKAEQDLKIVRVDLLANRLFKHCQMDYIPSKEYLRTADGTIDKTKTLDCYTIELKNLHKVPSVELVVAQFPAIKDSKVDNNIPLSEYMLDFEHFRMFRMSIIFKKKQGKRQALVIPLYMGGWDKNSISIYITKEQFENCPEQLRKTSANVYAKLHYTPNILSNNPEFCFVDGYYNQDSLERGVEDAIKKYGGGS